METKKISNFLNSFENEYSKSATKEWYIIDSESKYNYSHNNPIKFFTSWLESSLCDYSDAYVLVTRKIAVKKSNDANTEDVDLTATAKLHLKIVHHLKIVEQKSMILLLIMQILLILQCPSTIWLNIV